MDVLKESLDLLSPCRGQVALWEVARNFSLLRPLGRQDRICCLMPSLMPSKFHHFPSLLSFFVSILNDFHQIRSNFRGFSSLFPLISGIFSGKALPQWSLPQPPLGRAISPTRSWWDSSTLLGGGTEIR